LEYVSVNDQNFLKNVRIHSELLENYDRTVRIVKNK